MASLVAFFLGIDRFGAVNDVGNSVLGFSAGALSVAAVPSGIARRAIAAPAAAVAVVGAATAVVGSWLILSGTTDYYLAGLVSAAGFALIGGWLVALNAAAEADLRTRPRLRQLGIVTGLIMAVGVIGVVGIVHAEDDLETAPGWLVATGVSWLGTYLLLPLWCFLFAARAARHSGG
jgi:hypothetical protein